MANNTFRTEWVVAVYSDICGFVTCDFISVSNNILRFVEGKFQIFDLKTLLVRRPQLNKIFSDFICYC